MGISMEKIEKQAPGLVSLAKKTQFSLSKHDLTDVKAKVALVLDLSGSADWLYENGTMQSVAERILAVGTQFDDDGAIDVFFFHNSAWHAGELDISNYQGGIDRLRRNKNYGGTDYAAAFDAVREHYFPEKRSGLFGRKQEADVSEPVYVAFLTDGQTQDERRALEAAKKSSEYPLFFQSIGLGHPTQFRFLSDSLNDHGGKSDNFGFWTSEDITKVNDQALLDGLLNEFPAALRSMRSQGILR